VAVSSNGGGRTRERGRERKKEEREGVREI